MHDLSKCHGCRWFLSCYDINENGCSEYEKRKLPLNNVAKANETTTNYTYTDCNEC